MSPDYDDSYHGAMTTIDGLLYCAQRFPGGQMMFDSVPPWFSRRRPDGFRLSKRYTTPPMPFGLSADEALRLADTIPGVRWARDIALPPGRGVFRFVNSPSLDRIGIYRRLRP